MVLRDNMNYPRPISDREGNNMQHIGWVSHLACQLGMVQAECHAIPLPQFQGPNQGALDYPAELSRAWVTLALEALRQAGILEPLGSDDDGYIVHY
jgi:hypothetical protein